MRQGPESEAGALTPEEGWRSMQATLDAARSSMYLAGTSAILLVSGLVMALGVAAQYTVEALAPGFAERYPWFPAPLWGAIVIAGMTANSIIGRRASRHVGDGGAVRRAGIRVFLFWLAVIAAAFLIPGRQG